MNKYQKALECIGNIDLDTLSNGYDSPKYLKDFYYGEYKVLQELVDKAIPKKITVKVDSERKYLKFKIYCPTCGKYFYRTDNPYDNVLKIRCCTNCGQAIDRSDEND